MALCQLMSAEMVAITGSASPSTYGLAGTYSNFAFAGSRGGRRMWSLASGSATTMNWRWAKTPKNHGASTGYTGFAGIPQPTQTYQFFYLTSYSVLSTSFSNVVSVGNNGTDLVVQSSTGAELARVTSVFTKSGTSPFYYFEVSWTLGTGTTSTVSVRVDGTTVVSGLSVTMPAGITPDMIDSSKYLQVGFNQFQFQDLYLADNSGSVNNSFLGDCRVEFLAATATGSNTSWTNQVGSTKVLSVAADTSGYIQTTTVGARETFVMSDLLSTSGTVVAVEVELVGAQESTAQSVLGASVRVGGTNYDSPTGVNLPVTSYAVCPVPFDRSPATSTFWTASEVNALEAGPVVLS